MDIKSIFGYAKNSPYRNNPYLDIETPEGLITMENTDIDLLGIDNLGNAKIMKAKTKNPYKFKGNIVREIPLGNPYQVGGTFQDIFNYLFEDADEQPSPAVSNESTAPSVDELDDREKMLSKREKQIQEMEDYNLAMSIANEEFSPSRSFYKRGSSTDDNLSFFQGAARGTVNPYLQSSQNDLLSSYNLSNLGIWGDKSHQKRISDHNTGDAQDFGFDNPETADSAIAQLMKEAKQRNVKYIIYNGKIWNPSISPDWRPYKGPAHDKHFHVSYNR